uniref:Uncharacterized protein n=1 Tax=Pyramimonas orientalis virus TaxID=455367 RepID=A0A7M3UNP2_POV01|nr:hypothetical protein HWQ62_00178 [Pyramimonas orientalis virus]
MKIKINISLYAKKLLKFNAMEPLLCKVLICGYHERCGQDIIEIIVEELVKHNYFFYHKQIEIIKSHKFFSVFSNINSFDFIILCRRDVRQISSKTSDYSKFIEQYNCWSLFASIIIPFETSILDKVTTIALLFNDFNTQQEKPHTSIKNNNLLNCFLKSNNYY